MGFFDSLRAIDFDDLLSYNTVKVVKIKDRRLGILHISFLFGIFLYIIVYTVLIEKKYLLTDVPTGSFRLSLRRPSSPNQLADLPYCLQTNPVYNGFENYDCRYYEDALVLFPKTEETAMLISTRITQTGFKADCNFTTPDCSFQNTTDPYNFYIADIERYTIMIDHAFYATNIEIQRNGQQIPGRILDINGDEMVLEPPNQFGQEGELDIIELKTLLNAAGIQNLDEFADVDNTEIEDPRSMRYRGVIIIVIIDYTNTFSFNTSNVRYTLTARMVKNSQFKSEEQIFSNFPNEYIEWNRHGVRLLFQRRGTIGKFDFQTLLINIIAGAALVSVTTIAVDILAVYFLPQKKYYGEFKYEPTPDFSEIDKMLHNKELGKVTDERRESDPLLRPGSPPINKYE